MKRLAVLIGVALLFMVMGTVAQAVPTLGVASGTYQGDNFDCGGSYIGCFSGTYSSTDGWELGSSPATLTVFLNESNVDVWLLTTGPVTASVGSQTFAAVTLTDGNHWDGYNTPYWGIDLKIASVANGWTELNNAAMNPGQFIGKQITLDYSGILPEDQYFFIVADDNGVGGLQGQGKASSNFDNFSPKTTSSHFVPEPSTLLLLGSGILGIGFFGRKKFVK